MTKVQNLRSNEDIKTIADKGQSTQNEADSKLF